ncbi:hypothetical protein Tco_0897153, partial [Tanacetum coccineum]
MMILIKTKKLMSIVSSQISHKKIAKDNRGWLLDLVSIALASGGALNKASEKGFAQVFVGVEDVAVAVSHADSLINVDARRSMFSIGCQDSVISMIR